MTHEDMVEALRETCETIEEVLRSPNWQERAEAIQKLALICDHLCTEPFRKALADPDPSVRAAAIHALSIFDAHLPTPMLVTLAQDEEQFVLLRDAAITALERRGEPQAEVLRGALDSELEAEMQALEAEDEPCPEYRKERNG